MENFYWKTPQWVKDLFKPKNKTKLTINAYKEGDKWYFNKPLYVTWKESLCFPEALDEMAKGKTKLKLKISSTPVEGWEKMGWFQSDPWWTEANIYIWKNHNIWLCPWAQWWFGEVAEYLWFTTEE
jgi:hypothetical protein